MSTLRRSKFHASLVTSLVLLTMLSTSAMAAFVPSEGNAIATDTTQALPPLRNITAISSGGSRHTCALTVGGGVKCWGDNGFGQLGDGTTTDRHTPVDVFGLASGVTAITGGEFHTCAVTLGDGVKCWGYNGFGQLGDGTTTDRHKPVSVGGLSGVIALTAGKYHTCALTSVGGVQCWGSNVYGQLGDGTQTDSHMPVLVSGLASGVSAIAAGYYHSCAVISGGVQCWGWNNYGQLGDGTTANRKSPVNVSGLGGVSAIAAGYLHTCALTSVGGVYCWGANYDGQLGDGTLLKRPTPVPVTGLASGVTAVTAGFEHNCARTALGGVVCWGSNTYGQLGDGTLITKRTMPGAVIGLASGITAIAAGYYHTCARTTSGGVKCWGYNSDGQLGDGTTHERHAPVNVLVTMLTKSVLSAGSQDGWVLESTGTSGVGGSLNATLNTLNLGDNAANKQYRAILSFTTSGLPDTAFITRATLQLTRQSISGVGNPFSIFHGMLIDVRKGFFGTAATLQIGDFQAMAYPTGLGPFNPVPSGALYTITLPSTAYSSINRLATNGGLTQLRLRFWLDDNNNAIANFISFFSGNATAANRPRLVVKYYVP